MVHKCLNVWRLLCVHKFPSLVRFSESGATNLFGYVPSLKNKKSEEAFAIVVSYSS